MVSHTPSQCAHTCLDDVCRSHGVTSRCSQTQGKCRLHKPAVGITQQAALQRIFQVEAHFKIMIDTYGIMCHAKLCRCAFVQLAAVLTAGVKGLFAPASPHTREECSAPPDNSSHGCAASQWDHVAVELPSFMWFIFEQNAMMQHVSIHIPFCTWILFHYTDIAHFVYPFVNWKTVFLLLVITKNTVVFIHNFVWVSVLNSPRHVGQNCRVT